MEVAISLYEDEEVSLFKAAEIAGVCIEEFKESLKDSGLSVKVPPISKEESKEELDKQTAHKGDHLWATQYPISLDEQFSGSLVYGKAKMNAAGEIIKQPLFFETYSLAFTFATIDLKANWRKYRENFKKGD